MGCVPGEACGDACSGGRPAGALCDGDFGSRGGARGEGTVLARGVAGNALRPGASVLRRHGNGETTA